jgi:hypothetical protein
MAKLRNTTERACNAPQRIRARMTEAKIIEKMPSRAWLSCTTVLRLICTPDDRKTRAPLDRLVRDGKIEFKRVKGVHGSFPEQMLNYGYDPQLSEDAVKQPVFLTSTFVFRTAEDGQDFFDFVSGRREPPEGMGAGLVYSRFNRPTARSSSTGSLFTSAPRNARYSRPACRRLRPRFSPSFAQAT